MPDHTSENADRKKADIPDMGGPSAANPKDTPKNTPENTPESEQKEKAPTPITHRDKRNKYILHGLQASGGLGLVVSAIIEGNIGRLVTGGANAGRNIWQLTTLFNTKSRKSERKNEVLMNGVSASTNIPQLVTSASIHEAAAAASAVVAYSLRATRYKFSRRMAQYRAKLPPAGHSAVNILIKSTNKLLRFGPSVLLFNRAVSQTVDGLTRQDWAAFGSGIAFTLGAVFMAASDRKRAVVSKQIKEEKQEKKRQRRMEERELEVSRELNAGEQLESNVKKDWNKQKDKKPQKQKPANDDKSKGDKGGNIHSIPNRAAARPTHKM